MNKITVAEYLLNRLKEMSIHSIFGVPGDYNLSFLDFIEDFPGLKWIGNCNELNAAYAADGYARVNGISALVTTFGVGELSAINGIAGAYAEFIPIINIVGMPDEQTLTNKPLIHHSFPEGNFNVFQQIFEKVTVAQTCLNENNAGEEIDRVLREAWIKRRPVYIGIPFNVASKQIAASTQKLNLNSPNSNPTALKKAVEQAVKMITAAQSPIVLIDAKVARFSMKNVIEVFLQQTKLPFASMSMGKAIIDETHLQFMGNYIGAFTKNSSTREFIESSDCVVSFGSLPSDFNTGLFTYKPNKNIIIEIQNDYTLVKQAHYPDVFFSDFILQLTQSLTYHFKNKHQFSKIENFTVGSRNEPFDNCSVPFHEETPISQDYFWYAVEKILKENCTIIAEIGTIMFGAIQMCLPANTHYISQTLWASIGYSVGAFLGACIAAPQRQNILFVGDGSFQLTAQEISTMIRHRISGTIFLLNNKGYTIERIIHKEYSSYNDIQNWNYSQLPSIFDTHNEHVWSVCVETISAFEQALLDIDKYPTKLKFIEVKMDKMDCPEILQKLLKQ